MARHPDHYTVQSWLPLSQTPTWSGERLMPRSAMLRVFALADGAGSWRVLPGGLVRLAQRGELIAAMQRGGSSADVWALTEGEVDTTTLLPTALTPAVLAQRNGLRVLDSFGLQGGSTVRFAPNLRAGTSVYKLAR
eukprot:gene7200-8638_t